MQKKSMYWGIGAGLAVCAGIVIVTQTNVIGTEKTTGMPTKTTGIVGTLTIGGTGGDLGTMKILGAAYHKMHPGVTVKVLPSLGSGGGVKAVVAGNVDLAIASRPLKDRELAKGAKMYAYAKTPMVFTTHRSNPARGLTTAQLVKIYDGDMTTWPDGNPIGIIARNASDTDTKLVKKKLPVIGAAMLRALSANRLKLAFSDQENADRIEKLRWGLGISSQSVILGEKRPLKALVVDGVAPTPANIANGRYRMDKTYYFVTSANPGRLAVSFMAFARSAKGRVLLDATGHLVIGSAKTGR